MVQNKNKHRCYSFEGTYKEVSKDSKNSSNDNTHKDAKHQTGLLPCLADAAKHEN